MFINWISTHIESVVFLLFLFCFLNNLFFHYSKQRLFMPLVDAVIFPFPISRPLKKTKELNLLIYAEYRRI